MKRLVRLYPRRWRERYGAAEIDAFIERRRVTPRAVLDLMRGIFDARLHPALPGAAPLLAASGGHGSPVFVPDIGFRPPGTRVLETHQFAEAADATKLRVRSVAASTESTDVFIEWEVRFDHAACPPLIAALASRRPMEESFRAELVGGGTQLTPRSMARGSYSIGDFDGTRSTARATHALRFPPFPPTTDGSEFRIAVGEQQWCVSLPLVPARTTGVPLDVAQVREGISVRVTATTVRNDEVFVELEVATPLPLRQVAAALLAPSGYSTEDPEIRRARTQEMRRRLGHLEHPIVLEDERGVQVREHRRVTPPHHQSADDGPPYSYRFACGFEHLPAAGARYTVSVPFVDVSDFGPLATVDLSSLPVDVELGGHRFSVVATEPSGDEKSIVLEIPASESRPRFLHPARVRGVTGEFSWGAVAGGRFAMSTRVGDPPVVTFQGVALRVEGPWRLTFELPR
jgi:hypothetical protein